MMCLDLWIVFPSREVDLNPNEATVLAVNSNSLAIHNFFLAATNDLTDDLTWRRVLA